MLRSVAVFIVALFFSACASSPEPMDKSGIQKDADDAYESLEKEEQRKP